MSLFPKRQRTSKTPITPMDPMTPGGGMYSSQPPPAVAPRPTTNSRPPPAAAAPAPQKPLSDRPPPSNLLEVRRPSAIPIPREEPENTPQSPPVRDVMDIPPPAKVPEVIDAVAVAVEEPSATPPPVEVETASPRKTEAIVKATLRTEDLIRQPSAPFAMSDDDVPEGMATEDQLDNFRELRTRLLAMAAGLKKAHFTTLVVPLTSGAGGSFVARNLAAAFALQDGRAAMLVDCNLKHPTQHEAFKTPAVGLFDFLDEPDVQYDSLLRMTGIPALHLIPAGRARSKFREYFSSAPMKALMDAIKKSEYFVFLDGPTALGSPDARILSEFADFVILVVGYGMGTASEIAQAAQLFDPSKFAGVVFNQRG